MKAVFVMLCAAGLSAGTRVRPAPADYRDHQASNVLTIAAERLPASRVRNVFASELSRGYIVVEVAVYPSAGVDLDLNAADFALRCEASEVLRPAESKAIARRLQQQSAPHGRDIDVVPTAGVGYESRPYGRGVTHGEGVAVVVAPGAPGPASTDRDRRAMETELSDKALPNGRTPAPVAGYLYFSTVAKPKSGACELEYLSPATRIRMPLTVIKDK